MLAPRLLERPPISAKNLCDMHKSLKIATEAQYDSFQALDERERRSAWSGSNFESLFQESAEIIEDEDGVITS